MSALKAGLYIQKEHGPFENIFKKTLLGCNEYMSMERSSAFYLG